MWYLVFAYSLFGFSAYSVFVLIVFVRYRTYSLCLQLYICTYNSHIYTNKAWSSIVLHAHQGLRNPRTK